MPAWSRYGKRIGRIAGAAAFGALACGRAPSHPSSRIEWPAYAGDAAGTHWSPAAEITPATVGRLRPAWTWRPREIPVLDSTSGAWMPPGDFEATPLMVGDTLFLSTPFNRVVA